MKPRSALFKALDDCRFTAKQLSQASGVSEAQISRLRNGGEVSLENFEKLIDALPPDVYHRYWCNLAMQRMSDEQLYDLIIMAASQLKSDSSHKTLVLK